jgi:hypothetical protein
LLEIVSASKLRVLAAAIYSTTNSDEDERQLTRHHIKPDRAEPIGCMQVECFAPCHLEVGNEFTINIDKDLLQYLN